MTTPSNREELKQLAEAIQNESDSEKLIQLVHRLLYLFDASESQSSPPMEHPSFLGRPSRLS